MTTALLFVLYIVPKKAWKTRSHGLVQYEAFCWRTQEYFGIMEHRPLLDWLYLFPILPFCVLTTLSIRWSSQTSFRSPISLVLWHCEDDVLLSRYLFQAENCNHAWSEEKAELMIRSLLNKRGGKNEILDDTHTDDYVAPVTEYWIIQLDKFRVKWWGQNGVDKKPIFPFMAWKVLSAH